MVPTKIRTSTITVSWTCKTRKCLHTADFVALDAERAQTMALTFVARAPRDTAYTLVHPQAAR
jgi:hypothetical protein